MAGASARSLVRGGSTLLRRWQSGVAGAGELYDVVIVGAGMVGSALACSIGQEPSLSHKRVLLLESNPSAPRPVQPDDAYSNRVSAISLGSQELLNKIGAWKHISEVRANPFSQLYVWDACSDARMAFTRHSNLSGRQQESPDLEVTSDDIMASTYHSSERVTDEELMGHFVENRVILTSLATILGGCEGVEVQRGVRITEATLPRPQSDNPWVELTLSNGQRLDTRLLVGCDGPSSRVRQLCGFEEVGWRYNQTSVVATLHIQEMGTNSTAWQRFLPTGPIAMLPLSPSISSLVWTTAPSHAQALMDMCNDAFVEAVNNAFFEPFPEDDVVSAVNDALRDTLSFMNASPSPPRQLPPGVTGIDGDSRAAFPLTLVHCPQYVQSRVVLVGDAAHRIHPMAGLGVNLGFGDVSTLTSVLLEANSRGADLGALSHLLEYESVCQRQNIPKMLAIDGLKWLFSTSWAPSVLLRSVGFQLTNALPTIKDMIVDYAEQ